MWSGHNSQSVAESYQVELTIEAWSSFFVIKPKMYLDNKVIAFYQFSSNGKRLTLGVFFYFESFLFISGFSGFSFVAIEHIRKRRIHGKFYCYCFLTWDFSQTEFINVSLNLVMYLVTFVKFSVISVIFGVSENSGESTWPLWKLEK